MTTNDYPECYAKSNDKLESCKACEYFDSCKYCSENPSKDGYSGHVSYEQYSYSKDVAQKSTKSNCNDSEIQTILEFMLDLDNYTRELLHLVLHDDCRSTTNLANKIGVSRQAIHRKLIDSCHKKPELRKIFYPLMPRCKRILHNSARKNIKEPSTIIQMELDF